jgi:GNAT superfamily N-acetyltransferase
MIRPARLADVPAIMRLIRGLADYERMLDEVTITEAELRDALFADVPRLHGILAEAGGDSVGVALYYYTFNTFKARRSIFLEDLFVEPLHRGSGLGLALMRHLARLAVAENCLRIEWRVLNWNQPAIDFYRRLGAKPGRHWQMLLLRSEKFRSLAEGNLDG